MFDWSGRGLDDQRKSDTSGNCEAMIDTLPSPWGGAPRDKLNCSYGVGGLRTEVHQRVCAEYDANGTGLRAFHKTEQLLALDKLQNCLALGLSLEVPGLCTECDRGGTGLKAFFTTDQLSALDKVQNSLALGTSPVVRALVDPEGGMRSVRNLDSQSFTEWFKGHGGSQGSIDRMWNPVGELTVQDQAVSASLSASLCTFSGNLPVRAGLVASNMCGRSFSCLFCVCCLFCCLNSCCSIEA